MHTRQIAQKALQGILFSFLLLLVLPASAQTRITSPYSFYGVGELRFNQNIRNMGMGGLGIGFRSNRSVNDVNPASYAAYDSLSFIFEATLFSHFYEQNTSDASQRGNYTSLGNLMFGTPVTRWLSLSFGLKPFSSMGYKIRDVAFDDQAGAMNFLYEGNGGINQVFVGASVAPFKGFSLGANASYLFGALERHTVAYSDSAGVFLTNRIVSNQVNGWHFGMGSQYHASLGTNASITLGLIYGLEQNIDVSRSEVIRRQMTGSARFDTLNVVSDVSGTMLMPSYWGGGVYVRFSNRWQGGVDFQQHNWADYTMLGVSGGLINSYQAAAGVQFNPGVQTYSGLLSVLDYRAGLRYGQTYLNPNGHALDEFGISFGLGIPLRRSLSGITFGFEWARRGTTEHNLIKEDFYRFNLGVNIHERWYMRRRFF